MSTWLSTEPTSISSGSGEGDAGTVLDNECVLFVSDQLIVSQLVESVAFVQLLEWLSWLDSLPLLPAQKDCVVVMAVVVVVVVVVVAPLEPPLDVVACLLLVFVDLDGAESVASWLSSAVLVWRLEA